MAGSKSAAWISSQSLAFAILIGADRQKGNLSRLYRAQRPGGHPSSALTPACPTWVSFGVVGRPDNPGQREPVKADGRSGLQGRRGRTPRLSDEEAVVKARLLFSGERGPDGMALVLYPASPLLQKRRANSDDPGDGS